MNQFNDLSVDARIIYLLSMSELIISDISESEGYEIVVESIEKCWEWVELKSIAAYDLYLYLENMDDTGIITYMQFEDDMDKEKVWICIGNALAYTIREAYQFENEKYLPQTIESVDLDTVESFITNFNQVYGDSNLAEKLLHYLKMSYPKGTSKVVDINSVKIFINDIKC